MSETEPRGQLMSAIADWTPVSEEHRAAIGTMWEIAEDLLILQSIVLERIGHEPNLAAAQRSALMQVGVHVVNLVLTQYSLILPGRFDVLRYLERPLFDNYSLVLGIGDSPTFASRFLSGDTHLASQARRGLPAPDQEGMRQVADLLNKSSHTTIGHTLSNSTANHTDRDGDEQDFAPTVLRTGGLSNPHEARLQWLKVIGLHAFIVHELAAAISGPFGSELVRRLVGIFESLSPILQAEQQRTHEDLSRLEQQLERRPQR